MEEEERGGSGMTLAGMFWCQDLGSARGATVLRYYAATLKSSSRLQNFLPSFSTTARSINYLTTTSVASHNEAAFALRGEDITRCWAPGFEGSFRLF